MVKTIGIIGFGNMGCAIAKEVKSKYQIWVFDKDSSKTSGLSEINVTENITDLVNQVDVILLAIKPQDFDIVLENIKDYVQPKLIISIAAGINTEYIEKVLGDVRVVRVMPNIGVKIGKSVTCLCKGRFASNDDLSFAEELFNYLGTTRKIEEKMMDSSTAISGSGPAYIYDDMELSPIDPFNIPEQKKQDYIRRLAEAAQSLGFNSEDAMFLAINTINMSIDLIKKTKMLPSELKKQVTSKGGTTEAALEVLHKGGSWEEAAKVALKRAEELSKGVD